MSKTEIRRMIKPLVKTCVREVLLEEGILSNIVAEVAKGLSGNIIHEQRSPSPHAPRPEPDRVHTRQMLQEHCKKLMDAIGKDAYAGIDIFEGTEPLTSHEAGETKSLGKGSPLAGQSPDDPGVDISGILALGGKNWKALVG